MTGLKSLDQRPAVSQPDAPVDLPRLLASSPLVGPTALREHTVRYGRLPSFGHDRSSGLEVIELVDRSGLRGRGGASFPTALKLAAVAGQQGRAIVVGNGTEGEPASSKDKVLLARCPHLVLDGAVVASACCWRRRGDHCVPPCCPRACRAGGTRASQGLDRLCPAASCRRR